MPTLAELTESVYRDLADEAKVVFSELQVEDFIRGGIVELNRVSPPETVQNITLLKDTYEYATTITLPYSVELRDSEFGIIGRLQDPEANPEAYGHFTFRATPTGGLIELLPSIIANLNFVEEDDGEGGTNWVTTTYLHVKGYGVRSLPYAAEPSPDTGLTYDEEYAVRQYAKSQGFDLLTHDRALFAQWQGQTNNTDVSPVMMMNMAASAARDWDRKRGLIRTVRRYW